MRSRTTAYSSPQSANETSEVKAVVAKLAENWNRHDMTAFAALFADNADFVNVIRMHCHGRKEIETKHAQTHRTIFRNSVLQIVDVIVRLVSPTVALAHARTELRGAESLREACRSRSEAHASELRAHEGCRPLVNHGGTQYRYCSCRMA